MSRKRCLLITISFFILLVSSHFLPNANEKFEKYTYNLFCQEVSGNAITLHYTLASPDVFDIDSAPISFGNVTTDSAAIGASAENALAKLHSFEKSELSKNNQLIYDLLEDSFSMSCKMSEFTLYDEPLAPLTGTQAQLPILLSEYHFYSENDVITYLKLLQELPVYFQSILDFENAKSDNGLFMSSENAHALIEECTAFINMGMNHYLCSSFENRLSSLDLPKKTSDSYIQQNLSHLENYVFPAYKLLIDGVTKIQNTGRNDGGLCHFPNGRKYYSLLVACETGSSRTISELQALTRKQIHQDLQDIQPVINELMSTGKETWSTMDSLLTDSNPSSILMTLREKISEDFPISPEVDIDVKYVEPAMEDFLSPAFYLIPTIDKSEKNVIYVNPGHLTDDLTLFTTLAHEGYPGHLYQTTYFSSLNPEPIRSLLSCGGYTEGWATYCEMISYYYAPLNKTEATFLQKNASAMLGLYALADMGIHYDGWTLDETIDFFRNYGIEDTKSISEIYHLIIGDPGNYLKYYIGYIEFLELKKMAVKGWGNEFTQERFHKTILDAGPVPFRILYKMVSF